MQPIEVMKPRIVFSKASSILTNIPNYLQRRGKGRLYQQWVEKAGLSPKAIPQKEVAGDIMPKMDRERLSLRLLYILLGLSAAILCVGLILLIVHSC